MSNKKEMMYLELDVTNITITGNGTHGTVRITFACNGDDLNTAVENAEVFYDEQDEKKENMKTLSRALELLRDEIYEDMEELDPNSLEWCDLAERFIGLVREINNQCPEQILSKLNVCE